MEPPTVISSTKLEPVASRLDEASPTKHPGSTWPVGHQRSQMVAAWSIRQMQEPQVGGVPRSVLQRLLGTPVENPSGSPLHSPRRRCSAASAAMVSMVHSPRAFASNPLEKRDPMAQTTPYHCLSPMFPTPEFGSYESTSNCSSGCSSPIPTNFFPDGPIPSDDEDDESADEVTMLRQQVALLVKSLEDEKKRRASEQQLMQTKIIELQTLIRGNGDDEVEAVRTRENERLENSPVRRWSAPLEEDDGVESSCGCARKPKDSSGEATAKLQLTRLRARMHAIVIDAQRETQALRAQLEGAKRSHSKREKQLTLETTIKVAALEQKHAVATTRLTRQAADSVTQVEKLLVEKHELLACMHAQQERLKQLELALGGQQIVDASG
ncbi:hypothetical protein PI124_g11450 [Phytophthora idaei]|nr:hypothetical protein PI125_g10957 [Phytophthora idaei]KAG3152879.1 hypothetical protein PI126_g10325 [Phytophthora idaei]KAG3243736.1 hypothetical protein PI124_g11450 [Phytophthora idaei]